MRWLREQRPASEPEFDPGNSTVEGQTKSHRASSDYTPTYMLTYMQLNKCGLKKQSRVERGNGRG